MRGRAPTLDLAADHYVLVASNLSPFVALATNAAVAPLNPWFGFDSTASTPDRAFFASDLPEEAFLPFARREVPRQQITEILLSFLEHPEQARLRRAAAHYLEVLRHWEPGHEIAALAHTFMGMEALTPVALRKELTTLGLTSRDELANAWDVEPNMLDAEVRRRVLFQGTDDLYQNVKSASDGLEHGFAEIDAIRETAKSCRLEASRRLREAILRDLMASTAELLKPPYDTPFCTTFHKMVFGVVRSANQLDMAPELRWETRYTELPSDHPYDAKLHAHENVKFPLLDDASFEIREKKIKTYNDATT